MLKVCPDHIQTFQNVTLTRNTIADGVKEFGVSLDNDSSNVGFKRSIFFYIYAYAIFNLNKHYKDYADVALGENESDTPVITYPNEQSDSYLLLSSI